MQSLSKVLSIIFYNDYQKGKIFSGLKHQAKWKKPFVHKLSTTTQCVGKFKAKSSPAFVKEEKSTYTHKALSMIMVVLGDIRRIFAHQIVFLNKLQYITEFYIFI